MFQSLLAVRMHPGRGSDAMRAFEDRGALRDCAQATPGFTEAELRAGVEAPDRICVPAKWRDAESRPAWVARPLRHGQRADLGPCVVETEVADAFGPAFEG